MSNISGFLKTEKKNRIIVAGPATRTWKVPEGVTEVDVHVFGGGGNGGCILSMCSGGGGGGGYATTRLAVTSSDCLSITAGAAQGTSTVTVPTQSPTSPISATGGSSGCQAGGAGGSGAITVAPTQSTDYCFTASGGAGGDGCYFSSLTGGAAGGGGSAGSPLGNGKTGGTAKCPGVSDKTCGGGGASSLSKGPICSYLGAEGLYSTDWFNIATDNAYGNGGNGYCATCSPASCNFSEIPASPGGLFAGGGGGSCLSGSGCAGGAPGGVGGGGGGGSSCVGRGDGGVGMVIIYY